MGINSKESTSSSRWWRWREGEEAAAAAAITRTWGLTRWRPLPFSAWNLDGERLPILERVVLRGSGGLRRLRWIWGRRDILGAFCDWLQCYLYYCQSWIALAVWDYLLGSQMILLFRQSPSQYMPSSLPRLLLWAQSILTNPVRAQPDSKGWYSLLGQKARQY